MEDQFFFDALCFFRCQSALVLLHFLKFQFLILLIFHDTLQASLSHILQLLSYLFIVFKSPLVGFPQCYSILLLLGFYFSIDYFSLGFNALLQSLHIRLQLQLGLLEYSVEASSLLLLLDLAL